MSWLAAGTAVAGAAASGYGGIEENEETLQQIADWDALLEKIGPTTAAFSSTMGGLKQGGVLRDKLSAEGETKATMAAHDLKTKAYSGGDYRTSGRAKAMKKAGTGAMILGTGKAQADAAVTSSRLLSNMFLAEIGFSEAFNDVNQDDSPYSSLGAGLTGVSTALSAYDNNSSSDDTNNSSSVF